MPSHHVSSLTSQSGMGLITMHIRSMYITKQVK